MSSNTSGEGDIRRNLIEADLIDCIVELSTAFYSTGIAVCLWFLTKSKLRDIGTEQERSIYKRGTWSDGNKKIKF